MKNRNIFIAMGFLIFLITYMVNRFILEISDPIYIVLLVLAVASIIVGMIDTRKKQDRKE